MNNTMTDKTINVIDNRDDRFRQILHEQLGENGIPLMVNQAFLFILSLILIVTIIIGTITTVTSSNDYVRLLKTPALLT